MNDDPIRELKRELEREMKQHHRSHRVDIDLVCNYVARGEVLSGTVVVTAGEVEFYASRLVISLNGLPPSVGEDLDHHPQCLARPLALSAGEGQRFPFRIGVPANARLGENYLCLLSRPGTSRKNFRIDPEEPFGRIARAMAARTGLEIAAWFNGRGGDGMFVQLRPDGSRCSPRGRVGVEMRMCGGVLEGTLILDDSCPSSIDVLRALFRSNRRRIPFRLPFIEPEHAAEELMALLIAQSRMWRDLPLPALQLEGKPDELPLPHKEPLG